MRARDREAVLALVWDAHDQHRRANRVELRAVRTEQAGAVFGRLLEMPNSVYFVAEHGREIVGYVHCEIRTVAASLTTRTRKLAYVNTLAVRRESRRQGVGRVLMELVREWALGQEVAEIELNVFEFNREAIALYESLGYRAVTRRMRYEL
jgi:ribosomal protein S18 acetylase RimI-like enzyme